DKIEIRVAEPEPVEIIVEDPFVETMQAPPAETPSEDIVVAAAAPEPEVAPAPEPEEVVVEEVVEPVIERAETLIESETAPEVPVVETEVAALEPEPVAVELPVEEEAPESAAPSDAELEWARIDAALDVSDENAAPNLAAIPGEDAAAMHFDLAGVIIDGSSIYSASELLPSYRRFLGQEVSVNDL
ncbi:MAG: hypothetical protein CFH39_00539, partial [Alphaproteobacteria bacterium MarineAlpha10_Bin2]